MKKSASQLAHLASLLSRKVRARPGPTIIIRGHQMAPTSTLVALIAVLIYSSVGARAQLPPNRPTMFVLGDSLVDPGNNNYIPTIAKSNFPPNGEDFPNGGQATGRFCNGVTVADYIAQLMNIPFLPAYLAPTTRGVAILQGVNYASAAAGILDGTGANYIGRIPLNVQLEFLQKTLLQFQQLLTPGVAAQVIQRAFFYLVIGSNDYINNYLLPNSATRAQYTPQQYEDYLISEYSKQLTLLYNLGARKILIFNVGPLGCIPSQLASNNSPDGGCIEYINGYVRSFNGALDLLLGRLTTALPGVTFVYGDSYVLIEAKLQNPGRYGLTNVNTGCCGLGKYRGQVPCVPGLEACPNRNQYLFWDPFHPTDVVNRQLGQAFFTGPPAVIKPINIQQLLSIS